MNSGQARRAVLNSTRGGDPLADLPPPAGRITAIYAHVPFCRSRCTYCGFVTTNHHSEADRDNYLELLRRESDYLVKRGLFAGRKASLLYIGGGTPTVLSADELRKLTKWLTGLMKLEEDVEFTCEGHPRSLLGEKGQERLAALAEGGVNRLSLGVQDFVPTVLKECNRRHTYEEIREAVQRVRSAGIQNVNLDFIYGLPGQTSETWRETLTRAIQLRPANLTVYRIRLKPGTVMALRNDNEFPDENACAAMREINFEVLSQAGYFHVLANQFALAGYMFYDQFALPGTLCRYGVETWLPRRDTIGMGVSAYSVLGNRRFYNFGTRDSYDPAAARNQAVIATACRMSRPQQQAQMLLLGLRRPALGVDKAAFRGRFGCDADQCQQTTIRKLAGEGLVWSGPNRLCLTAKGLREPERINRICRPLYETLAGRVSPGCSGPKKP